MKFINKNGVIRIAVSVNLINKLGVSPEWEEYKEVVKEVKKKAPKKKKKEEIVEGVE